MCRFLLLAALLPGCPGITSAQGRLAEAREEIQGEDEERQRGEEGHTRRERDGGTKNSLMGGVLGTLAAAPLDDDGVEPCHYHYHDDHGGPAVTRAEPHAGPWQRLYFPAHPYPLDLPGYGQPDPTPVGPTPGGGTSYLHLKPWAVRVSLEDGNNFAGLNRFAGAAFVDTTLGLGFLTRWHYFHEDFGHGWTDDATLGQLNLTWRILNFNTFQARVGAGVNIFTDRWYTDAGGNVLFGFDVYPSRPWVVSGLIEGGGIGYAGFFHTRATVGYLFGGVEVYGGYDYIGIGRADLQGPLAGLRLWF